MARPSGIVLAVATTYFLAARLGLSLTFVNASASAVWPPTGVAIAALLVFGHRAWPGVTLGAYLANALTTGVGPVSIAIALGNTAEALAAAWLVRRFAGGTAFLDSPAGIARYSLLAGLAATMLSASVGVTALVAGGHAPAAAAVDIWTTWWLGDAIGALLVGIPLVAWVRPDASARAHLPETVFILGLLAAVALLVFSPLLGDGTLLLLLLPLPVLWWAALRLGARGASAAALLLAAVAIVGTLARQGPILTSSPNTELLMLQGYLAVCSVAALGLSAWARQRRRTVVADPAERLRTGALTLGLLVAFALLALGLTVLIGWYSGLQALKAPLPGAASMKANTALCFIALATAMVLGREGRPLLAGTLVAVLPIVVGSLTLVEYVAGISFGIDELLVPDDVSAIATSAPGRMSPFTAGAFVLLGFSILVRDRPGHWRQVSDAAAISALVVALLALTSYVYDAYLLASTTQIAIHTALGLLAAGFAVPLLDPGKGLGAALASTDLDGRLLRLLPLGIVLVPLLLGLVRLQLQKEGRITLEQGVVLSIFGTMVLVALVSILTLGQMRQALAQRRQALSDMERSEEHFRRLLEAAPDATLVVDDQGSIVLVNAQAERLFGYTRVELASLNVDALVPEASRPGHPGLRARYMADPHARPMGAGLRLSARRKDGELVPVEISLSPMQAPGGRQVIAAVRDVTTQREAQEALRKTLASVNEAERATGRGSWEWDVTQNKAVWSDGMYRLFGVDPKTFDNSNENFLAMVLEEDRQRMGQAIADALAEPGRFFQEYRLRRPDGSVRFIQGEGNVVPDTEGKARLIYGVVQDVTALRALEAESRKAEAAARTAQERFARVFQASPVAILLTREDGRIVEANPAFCRLTRYDLTELLAPGFRVTTVYEDPAVRPRLLARLREQGSVHDADLGVLRKDGEVRQVLASLQFVDLGGNTTIVTMFQDVTDLRRAQQERETRIANEAELERLRRTDQFRTEFINNTAHELRTPMTPLMLGVASLHAQVEGNQAAMRHLATVERAVHRLERVVGDMVAAADLQARTIALDRQRLNLGRELKAAVASHHAAAYRANLALDEPADPGLTVLADQARLQLALGHLMGNAIKFTPAGGRITVSARRDGEHARIEVEDTGIGLTRAQMDGLWRPYAQAHDKTQRTDSGTGLGLYVTKGIIDMHGGEVGVLSRGPGKGSTFWFTLPLAPGNVDPLRPRAAEPAKRARLTLDEDPDPA